MEWGRSEIDLHPLTPDGAGWKATTKRFMTMPRATDLEVDGAGRLYAASWEGAMYTYAGPNVGYVIRLAPKGHSARVRAGFQETDRSAARGNGRLRERGLASGGATRTAGARRETGRGRRPATDRRPERQYRSAGRGAVHLETIARRRKRIRP